MEQVKTRNINTATYVDPLFIFSLEAQWRLSGGSAGGLAESDELCR